MSNTATPLLDIKDLSVTFATRNGVVTAVRKVNLTIAKGETVGIVGESGSGKSVTSYATLRILDRAGRIAAGSIVFGGVPLSTMPERELRDIRGREISMIFQNPRAALNPIRRVGDQIADVLIRHNAATHADARAKAVALLDKVRITRPAERYDAYPFELSGGMCQRVVIALALACQPQLLIADEPTTGLDVTTQKAIMDLLAELARSEKMAALLITHDLGLAAQYCDRIVVMEKGAVVETAPTDQLFAHPAHPYTSRLIRATPRPGAGLRALLPDGEATPEPAPPSVSGPLLDVADLHKHFPLGAAAGIWARLRGRGGAAPVYRAVDGLSFSLGRGESLGLVGESGCGKSTTSAMIMRLLDPSGGTIHFDGHEISAMPARLFAGNPLRRRLQMVFQDPTDSLNPRFTAARAIADPLFRLGGVRRADDARARVEILARQVGLPLDLLDRFPHQMSGGQKARVGIARAIALRPDLLVLDEPTAALDVSVQAVVLNLLADLRAELGMSYLFVSHDLQVVRMLCDRVIVMRAGKIVETGSSAAVLEDPQADYTRALVAAIPHPPGLSAH